MQKSKLTAASLIVLALLAVAVYWVYPLLLHNVILWQKAFNLQLSSSLNQLSQQHQEAGITLILISFFYGIFHAIGPGHGKFILTSYLALEQSKLKQAVKISLASSIVQGIVAILLVSIIIVAFTLSRTYFNLTLKWVERGSFMLMILLGVYWIYQAWQGIRPPKLQIRKISLMQMPQEKTPLVSHHIHHEHCGCGHQHLPSSVQMNQSTGWKSQLFLILSIGSRPCSGAILVLFLSYTLNIYLWGILATLMMALGTGITLTIFALIVIFARHKAVQLKMWYFPAKFSFPIASSLKFLTACVLIGMGILLLHSSFIEATTGTIFRR
ncbi:nickel/cobalt transporter [Haemophilus parahaemolyticus]|uniref:Nickel/cobalt efflux system n=2 Tax=Haemophilus parahaemolyticus TaxID=735 RepID=A0AAE6MNC9_HAEPH|nr:nickel/cobalt transporter [Haemophilus parahaemolyticus]EIJ69943.1 high-affinity nickel-transport protein [Haemophilus parahaemolyticus HK385]OOR97895.1 cobalt transporter [Haemophilus parahaemolyticus]QEN10277.1 nickel/cobalt transporter [Haemophilus parahaemolyticus]QRP13264.1 nickel/cobalt transporter [Haemophilus parahaemolyticus]STO65865.1 nickel/cobalt ABC transporter permease [Haemophilus parahaemolyticus HK385]